MFIVIQQRSLVILVNLQQGKKQKHIPLLLCLGPLALEELQQRQHTTNSLLVNTLV